MIFSENHTTIIHRGPCNTIPDGISLLTLSNKEILLTKFYHITSSYGGSAVFEKKKITCSEKCKENNTLEG